jgi:hypothetical protein
MLEQPPSEKSCFLIFQYLNKEDLINISLINKKWWKFCMEKWFEPTQQPKSITKKEMKKNWKFIYLNHFRNISFNYIKKKENKETLSLTNNDTIIYRLITNNNIYFF